MEINSLKASFFERAIHKDGKKNFPLGRFSDFGERIPEIFGQNNYEIALDEGGLKSNGNKDIKKLKRIK